jgi:hypothetical protein
MANPDFPYGAFFKDRSVTPRVIEKARKSSEHDRKLAKAYAEVDAREDNVCQVSGVKLSPAARDTKRLREHHHIKGRNVKPEWVYESRRIVLCSKFVHDLFTGKALLLDSTDATQPLKLRWNRAFIKPGKEPIRLEGVVS